MCLLFIWEIFLLFLAFPVRATLPSDILQEVYRSDQQGEKTSEFEERKQAFNHALFLYNQLEEKNRSHPASLDHALANHYFQLEEYPWAILYYQRALKKDPHDPVLISHLEKAQKKLGVPRDSPPLSFYRSLLSEPFFPLAQQFKWIFWSTLITFLVCSYTIWFSSFWMRKIAASCAFFLFLSLSYFLFFYYLTPFEGILVTSTGFYRAPDWNQPQLTTYPLLAGSKVRILQITAEGNWLKISNSSDLVGYIPTANLRSI